MKFLAAFPDFVIRQRILRFRACLHAVPLVPIEEMEFDLDTGAESNREPAIRWLPEEPPRELGILWLRPQENYPFYLRETLRSYNQRQTVPRKITEIRFDGDPTGHIVAVAILHADAQGFNHFQSCFHRRTWWVKSYDAFHGYRPFQERDGTLSWYDNSGPAESVEPGSILPNQKTKGGWVVGDRSGLRKWDGATPLLRRVC